MKDRNRPPLLIPPFFTRLEHFLEKTLLPITGILLLSLANYITAAVGYLVGAATLIFGILMLIHAVAHREYANRETVNTAVSILLILCGIVVLLRKHDSVAMLGTIWGIFGLYTAVGDLNELVYRISKHQPCVLLAIETLVSVGLSALLLLHPADHFATHVRLLGAELILSYLHQDSLHHDVKTPDVPGPSPADHEPEPISAEAMQATAGVRPGAPGDRSGS